MQLIAGFLARLDEVKPLVVLVAATTILAGITAQRFKHGFRNAFRSRLLADDHALTRATPARTVTSTAPVAAYEWEVASATA